jgi:hypothetical protein
MKRLFYAMIPLLALALTACQQHGMDVQGSSTIPELEGKMLYLRVYAEGDLQVIDSARIQHGKFHFQGEEPDSAVMACLFLGDESIMPIVLDGASLMVKLDASERKVSGSELNDSLFSFIARKTELDVQLAELPRRESRMILDGMDHREIIRLLSDEALILNQQEDKLVTQFIKDNMHNCLAPGVFMIVTSNYPYPILNPQIEELIALGSPSFLNDAYVKEYIRMARENMEKMNE